ncbi:MAG TPA: GlsB/YeaQ/YmgE family stress response membrane protein [Candidatus Dormibacteraeota bacterium]|nr:GlsB/YeaQ/YmgE family stress response membrane protein [Candidatus Dormibacteraeota bacterium]
MELQPGGIIAWIVVGLVAGWLTGLVVRGRGYGLLGDLVLGLIGALIGGFVVGFVVHGSVGLIGSIVVAFIGAVILVLLLRLVSGSRTRIVR